MTSPPPVVLHAEAEAEPSAILFRPSKKRKIYRQRATDPTIDHLSVIDTAELTSPSSNPVPEPAAPESQSLDELIAAAAHDGDFKGKDKDIGDGEMSVAEILRLRKRTRPRIGGVGFNAEGASAVDTKGRMVLTRGEGEEDGDGEGAEDEGGLVVRKFAPQMGAVGDVNKHM